MTTLLGLDPGLATAALSCLSFDGPRARYVASWNWEPEAGDVPGRLWEQQRWFDKFHTMLYGQGLKGLERPTIFAVEDQRFAHLPRSGVAGRTNASALQPFQSQTIALAWAEGWATQIVEVQPMAVRAVAVGRGSGFSPPKIRLPARLVEQKRREHDAKVNAASERALRAMVAELPLDLSTHELDAVAVGLAALRKLMNTGQWKA